MANTKGLGKGLSALLGDDVIAAKDERASSLLLPISQVESCSTQPRKSFEPEALSDLADSIRIHGIIQPLTVLSSAAMTYAQPSSVCAASSSAVRQAVRSSSSSFSRRSSVKGYQKSFRSIFVGVRLSEITSISGSISVIQLPSVRISTLDKSIPMLAW